MRTYAPACRETRTVNVTAGRSSLVSSARREGCAQPLFTDFSRVRARTDSRCHRGETCPKDTLVDYQGHGTTTCDQNTGRMRVRVVEHCAGDCVNQHEQVHVGDRAQCCRRVKRCLDNANSRAERAACRDAFDIWFPRLSDWTECRAYTREVGCLRRLIADNCDGGGRGAIRHRRVGARCCDTLREELRFARGEVAARCPGVQAVCPFRADGSISRRRL